MVGTPWYKPSVVYHGCASLRLLLAMAKFLASGNFSKDLPLSTLRMDLVETFIGFTRVGLEFL